MDILFPMIQKCSFSLLSRRAYLVKLVYHHIIIRTFHGSGRVGSGRVGSGRVGSGRVGSGRVRVTRTDP